MIVTNLNATGQTLLKDTKISNNLNVSGTIIGNVKGDINGGMTDSTGRYRLSIDASGNLIMYDTSVNPWKLMPIGSASNFSGNFNGKFIGGLYSPDSKYSMNVQGYGNLWFTDETRGAWHSVGLLNT